MNALDVAVQHVASKVADPTERQRVLGLLDGMAKDCKSAIDLWQSYLKQPVVAPAESYIVMNWTGSALAKKLFDLHLAYRTKMLAVTGGRGNLEDPVVAQAYAPVKGQSGPEAANAAIASMQKAIAAIQAHAERIRNTKPAVAKAATKAPAKAKPAPAKKPAARKSKAAPKKKPPAKKPAVKKAAKKAVQKVVKKAVKKTVKKTVKKVIKKKGKKK